MATILLLKGHYRAPKGVRQAQKALIEASTGISAPARKSRLIQKRQEGLPETIRQVAWKAQCRLCGRYYRFIAKGKNSNLTKTAIARELAGFAWAIAQEVAKAA